MKSNISTRFFISTILGWGVVVLFSLFYNIELMDQGIISEALTLAKSKLDSDQILRSWSTLHGGVYVPITQTLQPSPYLSHVPNRDITTDQGQRLTLVNPAWMTRQLQEFSQELNSGLSVKLTSIKPVNFINTPDEWEQKSLLKIMRDRKELFSIETVNSSRQLRVIRPFITEERCLKCHAIQGYKKGDILGATAIMIPLKPLYEKRNFSKISIFVIHFAFFMGGWLIIGYYFHLQKKSHLLRDQYDEKLKKEQAIAVAANQAKSNFIARMSHELRTPLSAIIGFSELLMADQNPPLSEQQSRFANSLKHAGDHLTKIVEQLIDISLIEAQKIQLQIKEINLNELIPQIITQHQFSAQSKNIEINVTLSGQYQIETDQLRLTEVLDNLIGNAIKYSLNGGTVEFSLNAIDHEHLRFSVKDTGIGIEEKDLLRIFTAFERLEKDSHLDARKGLGLGLEISERLVRLLGGKLEVVSTKGVGSQFFFDLKMKATES